ATNESTTQTRPVKHQGARVGYYAWRWRKQVVIWSSPCDDRIMGGAPEALMVSPCRGAARRRGHHGSWALAAARALPVAVARGQGAHSTTSACPVDPPWKPCIIAVKGHHAS